MMRFLLFICLFLCAFAHSDSFHEGVAALDDENYDEAFRIFSQLAELGHVDALNNLGALYQTGRGTVTNYVYAANSYKEAAMNGHIDAAYNYSNLARLGVGIQRNMGEAYAWAIVAARHGQSDMVAYRGALQTRLKPDELTYAHQEAQEIFEVLSNSERALAWLLPKEIKLASRTLANAFAPQHLSALPAEKLSPREMAQKKPDAPPPYNAINQQQSTVDPDVAERPTKAISSYRSLTKTYPTLMNLTGQTIYRPLTAQINPQHGQLLRPRREIPAKVFPIVDSLDVAPELKQIFQSLARTYKVHINDVISAVQSLNPEAFEAEMPLRLKDPNYRLTIPSYQQVKPN